MNEGKYIKMQEITLKVEDKNLETVLIILKSLKDGLISEITSSTKTSTQYKPKLNKIIKEEESGTADTSGKYINPAIYKQRLKNKK